MGASAPTGHKCLTLNMGCKHGGLFEDKLVQYRHLDRQEKLIDSNVRVLLDARTKEDFEAAREKVVADLVKKFHEFVDCLLDENYQLLLLQECPSDEDMDMLFDPSKFGRTQIKDTSECCIVWRKDGPFKAKETQVHVAPNYVNTTFDVEGVECNVFSCHLSGYYIPEYDPHGEDEKRNDEELRKLLAEADSRSSEIVIVGGDFNSLPEHGTRATLTRLGWQRSKLQSTAHSGALDQALLKGGAIIPYENSSPALTLMRAMGIHWVSDHRPCFFTVKIITR